MLQENPECLAFNFKGKSCILLSEYKKLVRKNGWTAGKDDNDDDDNDNNDDDDNLRGVRTATTLRADGEQVVSIQQETPSHRTDVNGLCLFSSPDPGTVPESLPGYSL